MFAGVLIEFTGPRRFKFLAGNIHLPSVGQTGLGTRLDSVARIRFRRRQPLKWRSESRLGSCEQPFGRRRVAPRACGFAFVQGSRRPGTRGRSGMLSGESGRAPCSQAREIPLGFRGRAYGEEERDGNSSTFAQKFLIFHNCYNSVVFHLYLFLVYVGM